jgi:hydroxymethylglutaryl-CoA reductase
MTEKSRIPDFYKMSVDKRLSVMRERDIVSDTDAALLDQPLSVQAADKMIENVVGVFGLPIGLGLNFLINNKDYVIPLVVEEPSIVAGLSSAAKMIRQAGGFKVESDEPLLIGQIQVVHVEHAQKAQNAILQHKEEILNLANSLHPNMVARGGGARDLEVFVHPSASLHSDMLIVHLLVDTRDAMGANMVNTMCEGVAPLVETITHGKVFLRILSNLTDRAMVRARAVIPVSQLSGKGYSGEEVRDGVVLANDFAVVDPYRAATHNKGIMNGIDAVAIATGNDWRAIEAAAHAYAARSGKYASLTQWYKDDQGNLVGEINIPLKVGTVGGNLQSNPAVPVVHRILGKPSARELAQVMWAWRKILRRCALW